LGATRVEEGYFFSGLNARADRISAQDSPAEFTKLFEGLKHRAVNFIATLP